MKLPTSFIGGWCGSVCMFLVLSLFAFGCQDDSITGPGNNPNNPPPANSRNLLEIIQSNSNLKTLEKLLDGTTLSSTLSASGIKTVFAPSDAAFARLDPDYLDGLTNQQKLDLLRYHVYSGSYPVINEIKREAITSLHGDPLFVEIGQSFGNLLNNQAEFDSTNIMASNGQLHIIDEVLIPDQQGTLAMNIKKRYEYRKFYHRLENAGLVEDLQEPGTKTLLTTSDISLDWYENGSGMTFNDEEWMEIMHYHILNVDITVTGPGTRMGLVTMSGDSVYLTVDEPGQYHINGIGGNPVTVVHATNGKIISPGGIMLPDKYIGVLTLMDKRYNLRTARAALAVAKLTGRLYNSVGNGDEKFTIFIPKNDAEGLGSLPEDEADLAEILKYHILLEKVTSDQLQDNQTFTTWQGEEITISKNGNTITINGSTTIRQADLIGKNGVVHVIDKVLTPPTSD